MKTYLKAAIVAVAPIAFSASATSAQEASVDSLSIEWDAPTFRAEALEAKARAMMVDRTRWHEAANLYREAAALRVEGDSARVGNLLQAGWLAYYSEQYRRAYRDLEQAAEESLAAGDVSTSANAYLDAAWAAAERGDLSRVEDFVTLGEELTSSPRLLPAERLRLLRRTGQPVVVIAEDQPESSTATRTTGRNR